VDGAVDGRLVGVAVVVDDVVTATVPVDPDVGSGSAPPEASPHDSNAAVIKTTSPCSSRRIQSSIFVGEDGAACSTLRATRDLVGCRTVVLAQGRSWFFRASASAYRSEQIAVKINVQIDLEHQGQLEQLVEVLRPLLPPAPTEDELAEIEAAQDADRTERDARVIAFRLEHPDVTRREIAQRFGLNVSAVNRIIREATG
jgi:hypothetical protein